MKNKTIFLVMADTPHGRKNYPPYPLLYLGNALKKSGYTVKVRHVLEKDFDNVVNEICMEPPLLVGLSTITGLHVSYTVKLSKAIRKKNQAIPICWGGIHPSMLSEQCLNEEYIDFIVKGDGEETIVELANQLNGAKKFSKIKGLGYKKRGKIFVPTQRFTDLSKVRADFSLINIESYFRTFPEGQKRVLSYITSKGCPHGCTFCYNLKYNKRKWRSYPLKNIKEDIDFLKKNYDVDGISFIDDNFFVNKERAFKILEHLDLPSAFDLRMDYITEPLLKKLKKLKVLKFLVGVESGSDNMQKVVNKGYTIDYAKKIIKLFAKYHFRCHYGFIIALPTETREEIRKTVELMVYIIENHKEGTFSPGQYLPFPGTPLYDKAIEMGFKRPKTTEGWYVLDRWSNKMKLEWSPVNTNFCYYIKWYSFFIAARIPLITIICKWRLKTLNFKLPLELKLLLFIYRASARSNSKMGKIIRLLAKPFQFKFNKL
jgi:anaerobic magnesium-protoporphyrin IX monomethyl ester cyclase